MRSKLENARKIRGSREPLASATQDPLFIAATVELLEHIGDVHADEHNDCVLVYVDTDSGELIAQGTPAPDVRRVLIGLPEHLQMSLRIEPAG
jgi:hypothetical protein